MVELGSYIEAFTYVMAVKDCSREHASVLLSAELKVGPSEDRSRWIQLEVDLGNAYLQLGCYEQAETMFSGAIGRPAGNARINAQAQAGLSRALASRSRG